MIWLAGACIITAYLLALSLVATDDTKHFVLILAFLTIYAYQHVCKYLTTKENIDTRLTIYKLIGLAGVLGGITICLLLPSALVVGVLLLLGSMIATGVVREIELKREQELQ